MEKTVQPAAKIMIARHGSNVLLNGIFRQIGLSTLCDSITSSEKLDFDMSGALRLLTAQRILAPISDETPSSFNDKFTLPFMDKQDAENLDYEVFYSAAEHQMQIARQVFKSISENTKIDTSRIYCGIIKMTRDGQFETDLKYHFKIPLFLDSEGIPVNLDMLEESSSKLPSSQSMLKSLNEELETNFKRLIFISDRAKCSDQTICDLVSQGNGYIFSKSMRASSQEDQEWAMNPEGYEVQRPGVLCKSRIIESTVESKKCGLEKTGVIKLRQKCIVYLRPRLQTVASKNSLSKKKNFAHELQVKYQEH
jgi:hypothetical protein